MLKNNHDATCSLITNTKIATHRKVPHIHILGTQSNIVVLQAMDA